MKIGVVGIGIVGSAVHEGLRRLDHDMKAHDIKYDGSSIKNVLETEVCFVCVPTPSQENGECNTDIVELVVDDLSDCDYKGIVAIKSTVTPGTINKFSKTYPNLELCFVPEFLRERCAIADFIDNHDLCAIGTNDKEIFNIGARLTPAANSTLIINMLPIITPFLFYAILREFINRAEIYGTILSLAGLVVLGVTDYRIDSRTSASCSQYRFGHFSFPPTYQ